MSNAPSVAETARNWHHTSSREAERIVAGSVLHGEHVLDEIADVVNPDDFAEHAERLVYQTARDLRAEAQPIGPDTVYLRLQRTGKLADLRRPPDEAVVYLANLLTESGSGANGHYAATVVRDHALRRRFAHLCVEGLRDATQPTGSFEELVARFVQSAQAIGESGTPHGGPTSIRDGIRETIRRMDAVFSGSEMVIPTPIDGLNFLLNGGMRAGELHLLAARTSVGKSALALRVAEHAASRRHPVLFFSLEMSTVELVQRSLASLTGVPLSKIRAAKLEQDDIARIQQNVDRGLGAYPLHLDPRGGLTASQIAYSVRQRVRRLGIQLVVVDYVQLIRPEDSRAPRYQQIGEAAKILKSIASQCGVAVLALAQLNRAAMANEEPELHHLRDSGDLEQDADAVWMLNRLSWAPNEPRSQVDLLLKKQRNGPTGVVELDFVRQYARFEPRSAEWC